MKRSIVCVVITLLAGIAQAQERPEPEVLRDAPLDQVFGFIPAIQSGNPSVSDRFPTEMAEDPHQNLVFPNSLSASPPASNQVTYTYQAKRPVKCQVQVPNAPGQMVERTKNVISFAWATIDIDTPLETIELEGDAKRAAIQAITAARHPKLLQALKSASDETEKAEAAKKLEENYHAHYAAETAWRLESIDALKKRLQELETQLQERVASEDKYVQAAMTLANLHSQGILSEPPRLENRASALPETERIYNAMPAYSQPIHRSEAPSTRTVQ